MKNNLTQKQKQLLDYIISFADKHRYPPTYTEIQNHFKYKSIGTVQDHIKLIEKKGYIKKYGNKKARNIRVVNYENSRGNNIPVIGNIAAGTPVMSAENFEEFLSIEDINQGYGEVFALRIKGNSMINAGIYDDDYVIVRCQNTAENGDIVVADIEGETTVKRFYRKKKYILLKPENNDFNTMEFTEDSGKFRILGKVISLFRRL